MNERMTQSGTGSIGGAGSAFRRLKIECRTMEMETRALSELGV